MAAIEEVAAVMRWQPHCHSGLALRAPRNDGAEGVFAGTAARRMGRAKRNPSYEVIPINSGCHFPFAA